MVHHEDGGDSGRDWAAENEARKKAREHRITAANVAIQDLERGDLKPEDVERLSLVLKAKVVSPDEDDNDGASLG